MYASTLLTAHTCSSLSVHEALFEPKPLCSSERFQYFILHHLDDLVVRCLPQVRNIIIIMIIIIIIIVFKSAIRDFLQSPHCAVNHLQHVRSSGPGAVVCKPHATH